MRRRRVDGIAKDTLSFIMEASRSALPVEFAGLLRADDDIITDVLILPGTEASNRSALVKMYMLPNMRIVGSAHSHPSGAVRPSREDLAFFSRAGDYNIIAGTPFRMESWKCFDAAGVERSLPVVDYDFGEEFDDDFSEEDEF